MGIEPTYAGTTILCLNHLTTATMIIKNNGADDGNRTHAISLEG